MKDILIKQIKNSGILSICGCHYNDVDLFAKRLADYLIENGVIVPPCKVGDTVYVIMETSCEDIDGVYTICEFYKSKYEDLCTFTKGKCPYKYRIAECLVTTNNILHFTECWNERAFATKEEAEKALKGGVQE